MTSHNLLLEQIPLHPAQENIFFDQALAPNNPRYNIGWYQTIRRTYDLDTLQRAWTLLWRHLDALRLKLAVEDDGMPIQVIQNRDTTHPTIAYRDFSEQASAPEDALEWMQHQFDTAMAYLDGETYEVALLKIAPDEYYLFSRFHHLVIDLLGLYRLHEWLHRLYANLEADEPTDWLEHLPQYRNEVEKARQYLTAPSYERDKAYWQNFLANYDIHQLTPFYQAEGSGEIRLALPRGVSDEIREFCQEDKLVTLATLLSAVGVYFARTSGQSKLVMGTAMHGRRDAQAMRVIGMHSNVVPFACEVRGEMSFRDLVNRVCANLLKVMRHGQFPTSHLSRLSSNQKTLPDLQVLYDAFGGSHTGDQDKLPMNQLSSWHEAHPLQIRLVDYEVNPELVFRVTYARSHFSDTEAHLVTKRLINVIERGMQKPDDRVSQLPLLLDKERSLLRDWNQTDEPYPQDPGLHHLFEAQVEKTPNHTALIFQKEQLTYRELNQKANQLAHAIRDTYQQREDQPLRPDTLIALYFDRSIEMVLSILAVLKAGAAYVPLAPEYPQARTLLMLADAQPPLVITQEPSVKKLNLWFADLVNPPTILTAKSSPAPTGLSNPNPIGNTDHLAYVIYTSGTTGEPKGVMIEHRSATNLIRSQSHAFGFSPNETVIWLSPYTFDASVEPLFLALLNGARLLIPTLEDIQKPERIKQFIAEFRVTHLSATPGYLTTLGQVEQPHDVKRVVFGGEAGTQKLKDLWGDVLVNEYGLTESAVTSIRCMDYAAFAGLNCIGKPIGNTHAYVLSETRELVPVGVPGELYLGGLGLARGYLNRQALTAKRFIENPFAEPNGGAKGLGRLYRTGDVVRWLPDGNLDFLGRRDTQVKIRGFRVELGEIESVLLALPEVKQAAVIDREHEGLRYLAAFTVPVSGDPIPADELRDALSSKLPDVAMQPPGRQID